jgi:site-specific recombinase XerD
MASLTIRRSAPGGAFTRSFYGKYTDARGKVRVKRLSTPMDGKPPPSGLIATDFGDAAFERSKQKAKFEIDTFEAKIRERRSEIYDITRLVEARRGEINEAKIEDLPAALHARHKSHNISPGRRQKMVAELKHFMGWCQSNGFTLCSEVSREAATRYAAFLVRVRDDGCAMSAGTAETYLTCVRVLFNEIGVLPSGAPNPFDRIKAPRAKDDKVVSHRPLSPDETKRLLEVSAAHPLAHDIIVAALHTGQRRGDVLALKWEAVDMPGSVIHITQSKTGATVHLPIFGALREMLSRRAAARQDGDPFVFGHRAAEHSQSTLIMVLRVFKKAFGKISTKIGNRVCANNLVGLHSLRATFISEMLKRGWTIEQVSTITGHASARIIYKHYYRAKGTDFAGKLEADFASFLGSGDSPAETQAMREIRERLPRISPAERATLARSLAAPADIIPADIAAADPARV